MLLTKDRLDKLGQDPEALESLYREAQQRGQDDAFRQAVTQCLETTPGNVLLRAWACRLDLDVPTDAELEFQSAADSRRHWATALSASLACGTLFVFFARGQPPVPIPGEAHPLFWIGCGPLVASSIVAFLAVGSMDKTRMRWYGSAAAFLALAVTVSALYAWNENDQDQAAVLMALHLPFVAWSVLGVSVIWNRADQSQQFFAFIVESMEALLAGGICLGAGAIFIGLTAGIFAVLGVQFPDTLIRIIVPFGLGLIPVLAVAAVYDPRRAPTQQEPTGLARILRIMTWLLLPLALGVLAIYIFWFIPNYFWRAFDERDILVIYNATIIAILALLAAAVSTTNASGIQTNARFLRPAILSLTTLGLSLNVYALAAIVSRFLQYGFTPNRHAVLGWNIVTLLMLALLLSRAWPAKDENWIAVFRASMAQGVLLASAWAAWVVWGIPLL
ncbi:MAG TPA: hypothetical protein QGG30_04475 [Acidobacteriota bacterium]|nr:hypothetical protein [Acidobacteriota bacterium]